MPVLGVIVTGALVAVAGRLVLWEAPQVRRRAAALLLLALIVLGVSLVGAAQAHASMVGNLVIGSVVLAVGAYLMWAALSASRRRRRSSPRAMTARQRENDRIRRWQRRERLSNAAIALFVIAWLIFMIYYIIHGPLITIHV